MHINVLGAQQGASHIENDHYEVNFTEQDVLMNLTLTMTRGEIKEFNVTLTEDNSSLTIIVDINPDSGRLWGLYFEENSTYYSAKSSGVYKSLTKLMDHVTIYTVIHITRNVGSYALALHDSHLHEEPDTTFNLIVLNGHLGQVTHILPETTDTNHMNHTSEMTPGFELAANLVFLIVFSLLYFLQKKRK